MTLKFACLILDHDDTAVDSTSQIHYPAHLEIMRKMRPGFTPVELDGWFQKNFDPGIMDYLRKELKFSDDELEVEFKIWRDFNESIIPSFFPGFLDIVEEFRRKGGLVTVVSHSEVDIIEKHYESATNGALFLPDRIHGWTHDAEKRKPNPYPVKAILKEFGLNQEEVLVVDDLKPGVEMAKAAGVQIAAAGWSHQIPEIQEYMKDHCDAYLNNLDEFRQMIFH